MNVEAVTEEHLGVVRGWWLARGDGAMPDGVLPPHGFVAVDADGPTAAVWVYFPEGVRLAIVDWMVTRPGLEQGVARKAGRDLLVFVREVAKGRGVERIFATVMREGMVREAERCGLQVAARGAVHLVGGV